jgi:hypothetical protein
MKNNLSQKITKALWGAVLGASFLCPSAHAGWVTWDVSAGGNGHSYLAVPGFNGLTWNTANALAQAQGGYLATITSAAENNFVFNLINSPQFFTGYNGAGPALGGYQYDEAAEPAGHWAWVTGEAWSYTNWLPGAPNDIPAGQDNLHFHSGIPNTPGGTWDDINGDDGNIGGYVIEVVPEPSSLAILGCGALFLARRWTSKRKANIR